MASGEVSWDDENDVKEIIADVRDVECDMSWCVLRPLGLQRLFEPIEHADRRFMVPAASDQLRPSAR
jgi:hypothetical protein